mmetsp:Transcript_10132/g.15508  ORF Transcript_10132/g.15508 Transcript_10132/m.15508 type:complete len:83 (+) Transcript_10132:165-413(+)
MDDRVHVLIGTLFITRLSVVFDDDGYFDNDISILDSAFIHPDLCPPMPYIVNCLLVQIISKMLEIIAKYSTTKQPCCLKINN